MVVTPGEDLDHPVVGDLPGGEDGTDVDTDARGDVLSLAGEGDRVERSRERPEGYGGAGGAKAVAAGGERVGGCVWDRGRLWEGYEVVGVGWFFTEDLSGALVVLD